MTAAAITITIVAALAARAIDNQWKKAQQRLGGKDDPGHQVESGCVTLAAILAAGALFLLFLIALAATEEIAP